MHRYDLSEKQLVDLWNARYLSADELPAEPEPVKAADTAQAGPDTDELERLEEAMISFGELSYPVDDKISEVDKAMIVCLRLLYRIDDAVFQMEDGEAPTPNTSSVFIEKLYCDRAREGIHIATKTLSEALAMSIRSKQWRERPEQ